MKHFKIPRDKDEMEILERSNFDCDDNKEITKSAQMKHENIPKAIANAHVTLQIPEYGKPFYHHNEEKRHAIHIPHYPIPTYPTSCFVPSSYVPFYSCPSYNGYSGICMHNPCHCKNNEGGYFDESPKNKQEIFDVLTDAEIEVLAREFLSSKERESRCKGDVEFKEEIPKYKEDLNKTKSEDEAKYGQDTNNESKILGGVKCSPEKSKSIELAEVKDKEISTTTCPTTPLYKEDFVKMTRWPDLVNSDVKAMYGEETTEQEPKDLLKETTEEIPSTTVIIGPASYCITESNRTETFTTESVLEDLNETTTKVKTESPEVISSTFTSQTETTTDSVTNSTLLENSTNNDMIFITTTESPAKTTQKIFKELITDEEISMYKSTLEKLKKLHLLRKPVSDLCTTKEEESTEIDHFSRPRGKCTEKSPLTDEEIINVVKVVAHYKEHNNYTGNCIYDILKYISEANARNDFSIMELNLSNDEVNTEKPCQSGDRDMLSGNIEFVKVKLPKCAICTKSLRKVSDICCEDCKRKGNITAENKKLGPVNIRRNLGNSMSVIQPLSLSLSPSTFKESPSTFTDPSLNSEPSSCLNLPLPYLEKSSSFSSSIGVPPSSFQMHPSSLQLPLFNNKLPQVESPKVDCNNPIIAEVKPCTKCLPPTPYVFRSQNQNQPEDFVDKPPIFEEVKNGFVCPRCRQLEKSPMYSQDWYKVPVEKNIGFNSSEKNQMEDQFLRQYQVKEEDFDLDPTKLQNSVKSKILEQNPIEDEISKREYWKNYFGERSQSSEFSRRNCGCSHGCSPYVGELNSF